MSEVQRAGLKDRLVAGLERNGKRRRFDARAKDELIRACREPGAAIARIAREHGLNPNLLRQWINRDRQSLTGGGAMAAPDGATPAFMPVVMSPCKPARRTPKDGKAVDAESALAEQALGLDRFARAVYVFRNRRADRIKLLLCEETRRQRATGWSFSTRSTGASPTFSGGSTESLAEYGDGQFFGLHRTEPYWARALICAVSCRGLHVEALRY